MKYTTPFTTEDVNSLRWFVDRGYFPEEFYKGLHQSDEDENIWVIAEHRAWSLPLFWEDNHPAFLTCMADELVRKVFIMLEQIV